MPAIFPPTTTEDWIFNGVTYRYDATEDRWFVISSLASDQVVENLGELERGLGTTNDLIERELENRDTLLDLAADKNNDQDASIAELDQRVDAIASVVGALEFKGRYQYVLEKTSEACTAAYAQCLVEAGGDVPAATECNRLKAACDAAINDPYGDGVFTTKGTSNVMIDVEEFIFSGVDLDGQVFDWINVVEEDDYIEFVEANNGDSVLYQCIEEPKIFRAERSIRVKYLKDTGEGDGKFNLTEDYELRVIKASQGIDMIEADTRYVQKPYSVMFADTAPTNGQHPDGVLRSGELWYDTVHLELFVWNNNSWTASAKPASQDVMVQSVIGDVDRLMEEQTQQSTRVNSLISDLLLENNIFYSDGPPVGDITGTLRNGDLWVDSDDLTIKFYSQGAWINPDRQVGGDYLETTGGKMTGAITSKIGGTNNVAFTITNSSNDNQCLNIWAPGGAGQQIKYVGRNNTQHWFQVYDDTNNNPLTTSKFGYETYSFLAKPNVSYSASDAHYFKSNVIFNNGNGDLKAKVSNSNFDFYNLGRFQQGFVVKAAGEDIGGDNSFSAYPDRVSYSGRIENDTDIVNKQYVDDKAAASGDSLLYVAKNGLWDADDWQNSTNDGKFSAGGDLSNGNHFWYFSDIDQNGKMLNLKEFSSSDKETLYIQIGHYSHTYLNGPDVNRDGMKIVWAGMVEQATRTTTGPINNKVNTPGWQLFLNRGTGDNSIPGGTITSGGTYYIKFGGLL